jgi:hypothetical protein
MTAISVKTFTESDLEDYLNLSQKQYGPSVATHADHNRWKHLQSPFGASSYVRLMDGEQVVGRALVQRRTLRTRSEAIPAGCVVDLLIDRPYRTTPRNFLNITKTCDELEGCDLIYHTANERTFPLYSRLLHFPSPFSLVAFGLPVRLSGFLGAILGRRINALDWLTAPWGWLIDILAYAALRGSKLSVSQHAMSDSELETLSKKCLGQTGPHLARTTDYLKWRFRDAPLWPATVSRLDCEGQFLGYVATRCVELKGINHFVLMDMLLDPEIPRMTLIALRFWLLRQVVSSRADAFFTMLNPFNTMVRKLIGFPIIRIPERLLPHKTPIYMRVRRQEFIELTADRSIHVTLADLDYF